MTSNKRAFIIAEAGVNHNGDLTLAKELISAAAEAGADCVKFQSFRTEELVSLDAPKANYQILNTGRNDSQYEMLKKLELSRHDHLSLIETCRKSDIKFLSSPFSATDLTMLLDLQIRKIKIPSGELTNYPLLRKAGSSNLPILLSTGMGTLGEIEQALDLLSSQTEKVLDVTLLHCTSEYPAPYDQVNLRAMQTLADTFGLPVGLSDHSEGNVVAIAAVALGACVIEKHFTLDRNLPGPDHKASLEPSALQDLVRAIRQVESSLGSAQKRPTVAERCNQNVVRKSLYVKTPIKKGETLREENLQALRPEAGISPMEWEKFLGRAVRQDLESGHLLDWTDLAN